MKVTVFDHRHYSFLDLDVEGADALRAFEHPFAFANSRSFAASYEAGLTQRPRQRA